MRALLAIADSWGLSDEERRRVLGAPALSAYDRWLAAARTRGVLAFDVETLTRISAVLGIHQALGILHPNSADVSSWLRTPDAGPPFDGRMPLDLVTGGTLDGLLAVRRFLDGMCGGGVAPNEVDLDARPYDGLEIVVIA